jgi:hypothetical protein
LLIHLGNSTVPLTTSYITTSLTLNKRYNPVYSEILLHCWRHCLFIYSFQVLHSLSFSVIVCFIVC